MVVNRYDDGNYLIDDDGNFWIQDDDIVINIRDDKFECKTEVLEDSYLIRLSLGSKFIAMYPTQKDNANQIIKHIMECGSSVNIDEFV